MLRKCGYWMVLLLIFYVICVFYIISTLKLNEGQILEKNDLTDDRQNIRGIQDDIASRRQSEPNVVPVVVESLEEDVPNLAVGRNILIEKGGVGPFFANQPKTEGNGKQTAPLPVRSQFRPIGERFYVYSSYFDDRLRDSFIRIVAIGPRKRPKSKSGLMCIFESQKAKNGTVATDIRLSETCENHKQLTSFYLMSCLVPNAVVKQFRQNRQWNFKLKDQKSERDGFILTAVNNRPFRSLNKTRSQFCLCVPPLYGDLKPLHFVEFMELSLLLGVEHFTFYDYQIGPEIRSIVKVYENLGIVTVLKWNIPDVRHIWSYGQSASIADCIYRNMYNFQIVALSDIDEFIIPRHLESWKTMLAYLENQNRRVAKSVAAYRFKSSFYHGNTENVTSEWRMFKSLSNILRTKTVSDIRTKLMVYPETVFELGIHHLSQPIKTHYKTLNVDGNTALVHHYRNCKDVQEMTCGQFIEDYTAQRYGKVLVENTKRVLRRAKTET
ncbi:hypothetical protein LOTGIDRAFT_239239 [Lottia gigantea]|uniref:Glycosyltransferase family 92 protein n=1 Tax=Lottia gigantea TaxID=225164 RepID=V3ZYV9_LOTGI|nr:hypothetical protein LOTGIDRAFT_239239 [Lottia gigantea]ESO96728.1 hypothetical protein LOTGIDRAFT_239239 [Lottia gigantea]